MAVPLILWRDCKPRQSSPREAASYPHAVILPPLPMLVSNKQNKKRRREKSTTCAQGQGRTSQRVSCQWVSPLGLHSHGKTCSLSFGCKHKAFGYHPLFQMTVKLTVRGFCSDLNLASLASGHMFSETRYGKLKPQSGVDWYPKIQEREGLCVFTVVLALIFVFLKKVMN